MERKIIEKFIGKEVQLYPGDTYYKYVEIVDVDDVGTLVRTVSCHKEATGFVPGKEVFIPHAKGIMFAEFNRKYDYEPKTGDM